MGWRIPSWLMAIGLLARFSMAVDNGLARTPQMGWNNWNSLACDVAEDLLLDTASLLVNTGLKDLGYQYVILDDCWSDGRDSNGEIQVDKQKFPRGMKWVSDQLHAQDLLFGMYSSAGHLTCARYEGSLDHEKQDAQSFASFGIDYLKYDNCYAAAQHGTPEASFKRYKVMADALNATGRPILYSLCNWGQDFVHDWGTTIANSWRIFGDIYDSFTRPDDLCSCGNGDPTSPWCTAPGSKCSVLSILNRVAPIADRAQPGGWHDLDMLEVGVGGMTDEEYKAHFAMWAALKSPLIIGADLRHLSASALSILNNPAIIAINQDPLGRPATRVRRVEYAQPDEYGIKETQIWSGPLAGGDQVVILLNAGRSKEMFFVDLPEIFAHDGPGGSAPQNNETWDVHDLWNGRMEHSLAKEILKNASAGGTASRPPLVLADWYNATAKPYVQGLKDRDSRLLGKKVHQIEPFGRWMTMVPGHSAMVYRLISQGTNPFKRHRSTKDEL